METYPRASRDSQPSELEHKLFGGFISTLEARSTDYLDDREAKIGKGEPTFIVLSFDSPIGVIIHYMNHNKFVGFIDYNFGFGADVFVDGECVTDKPVAIVDAVEILESIKTD